jgi:hypothetical protein
LRVLPAAEELRRELLLIGEAECHAAARAVVAVTVAVGVVAEIGGIADGVETFTLAPARLQRETPSTIAAGQTA